VDRRRLLCRALVLASLAAGSAAEDARPDFDAERLQTGVFRYRTVVDGKDAGGSRIEVRKSGAGDYVFTNVVEGAFSQSWEAVASGAFAPVSAKLTMGAARDARSVFELTYGGGRVAGFASAGKDRPPGERRSVDEAISADTVDQRIDWAAVMAVKDLVSGSRFSFHVFDPGTGLSRIAARVLGLETTAVPAGNYETARVEYRIEKNRGTETYVAFVKSAIPRLLVKETFPNGAVTELTGEGR
jgi:hypothetical protein